MSNVEIDNLKETLKEYADYAIKLVKENKRLQQENKQLKESLDFLWNKFKKVNTTNRKVKEYIKDLYDVRFTDKDKRKLLEILGDKE